MRGRTIFLAVVAALSLLSATAMAGGLRVVKGTKGGDELTMTSAGDRVHARSGDDTVNGGAGNDRVRGGHGDDALFGGDGKDRLRGGQDNDLLDGGDGDDYLNGGGDGRDKDKIVCGDGYDVVVLGKNDVVLVEVSASGDVEEPEAGADDDCEKVKRPGRDTETCASTNDGCERESCAASRGDCERETCAARTERDCYPSEEVCAATYGGCDDPVVEETEPDEPAEDPEPDEL